MTKLPCVAQNNYDKALLLKGLNYENGGTELKMKNKTKTKTALALTQRTTAIRDITKDS